MWTAPEASEWGFIAVSLVLLLARPAAAQDSADDPVQQARERFRAGVECVQEEDWPCSEARFREALELHDAATIRYNLASVLVEQDELPEAARLATSVVEDEEADEAVQGRAQELLEVIAERSGTAEVVLDGAPEGAELQVDGEVVPPEQWSAIPLAAGEHTFTVHADGAQLSEQSATFAVGEPQSVAIVVVATPEQAAEGGGGIDIDFDALFQDPIFWAVAGGAVLGVVLIVVIVAVAASSGSQDPVMGDFEPGVIRW